MDKAIMIGLDIAKNVFEVHGRTAAGELVLRRSLKRRQMEKFFAKQPAAVIGMEACGAAHHWARALTKLGHEVRLMPPAYVKPYVKRNKSDAIDAAACWEAVGRPDMRFVAIKTEEQQGALSLHRSRELLMSQRTQLANALRALLAEFGIVAGKGRAGLAHLVDALRAGTLELPADAVAAARVLADQHASLTTAADSLESRIVAQAKADRKARLLQTRPASGRSARMPRWPPCRILRASRAAATSPPGWASRRGSPAPAARPAPGASPSKATSPCAACSCSAPPPGCRPIPRRPRRGCAACWRGAPRRSSPSPRRPAPPASCGPC